MGGNFWAVAITRVGMEFSCERWLISHRITAYVPTGKIRRARRSPKTGHDIVDVVAFPGYCFFDYSASRQTYKHAPGVLKVLMANGNLTLMARTEEINVIRQRQLNGEFDQSLAKCSGRSFVAGDRVIVVDGPFTDFEATVLSETHVEVNIFGRSTRVVIDQHQLRRA